jgi:surface carbohydrate biosynthesis protein
MLYILCELKSRDYVSGLMIAAELLRRGERVIIGQRWSIGQNAISGAPPGAVLFRTANQIQAQGMAQCHAAGHAVLAMDEEGLPFAGAQFLVNISPEALAIASRFLALSTDQAETLAATFPHAESRLVITGTPRIDALRAADFNRPIAGPYLLFNTNFGLVNSIWGDERQAVATAIRGLPQGIADHEVIDEYRTRVLVERKALVEITEIIRWAARHSGQSVVIRPHPSEKAEYWKSQFSGMPTVRVVVGSEPGPWIKFSNAAIHADSTTGLEAAALGTSCLNVSVDTAWSARFLMSRVNPTVTSAAEAIEWLKSGQSGVRPNIDALFPSGSAAKIAEAMCRERVPGCADVPTWTRYPRSDEQRRKFTAGRDETGNALRRLGVEAKIEALDDSVFMLQP